MTTNRSVFVRMGNPFRFGRWSWFAYAINPMRYYKTMRYVWQRVFRGWADCDVWEFDSHLAAIAIGGLQHLRDTKPGLPMRHDGALEDDGYTPKCLTSEEWDGILATMQRGFQAALSLSGPDWPGALDALPPEEAQAAIRAWQDAKEAERRAGFDLFRDWYGNLWT